MFFFVNHRLEAGFTQEYNDNFFDIRRRHYKPRILGIQGHVTCSVSVDDLLACFIQLETPICHGTLRGVNKVRMKFVVVVLISAQLLPLSPSR